MLTMSQPNLARSSKELKPTRHLFLKHARGVMLFTHLLQFLPHGDAITANPTLLDHCIIQVDVGITQPHDLRHLLHRCYELLDLAHDPTVFLRIVPAYADKQTKEIAIVCTQT